MKQAVKNWVFGDLEREITVNAICLAILIAGGAVFGIAWKIAHVIIMAIIDPCFHLESVLFMAGGVIVAVSGLSGYINSRYRNW